MQFTQNKVSMDFIQWVLLTFILLMHLANPGIATGDKYLIGTGRYDITGPSVEIEMV